MPFYIDFNQQFSDGLFIFICFFYVLLFCIGMWAFNILAVAFAPHIKWSRFLVIKMTKFALIKFNFTVKFVTFSD